MCKKGGIILKVTLQGIVEDVKLVIREGKSEHHLVVNQTGEYSKIKVKIMDGHPVPTIGDTVSLFGRVVAGVYQGRPYEFLKVG